MGRALFVLVVGAGDGGALESTDAKPPCTDCRGGAAGGKELGCLGCPCILGIGFC
jgi:hypothetical protein